MIEHTHQVLGYRHLLTILSNYASCSLGQEECLKLKPSNELQEIENELRLVSEMRLLLKTKGFAPFPDLIDLDPLLRKSRAEGSWLEPAELLHVLRTAESARDTKKLLSSQRILFPRLWTLMEELPVCADLMEHVNSAISRNGEVKDSASPDLKNIREKKIRLRSDLEKKLERIKKSTGLSEDPHETLISIRDGRYVIAVRSAYKRKVKGIVHDFSHTHATCFLEPVEAIHDNNRMSELSEEERAAEIRILTRLTGMTRDRMEDLRQCQTSMARLDGLYARARFGEALSCVAPIMGEKCDVSLRGARNPILILTSKPEEKEARRVDFPVPVDILLDDASNVLLISGPNRGGKTAALKTLGLMSLMAQSGLHIPAEEGSELRVFDHIMADIGDDQDLRTGVSTFSAHAEHLKSILDHVGRRSLVIIDEPGMGTDPDEGVALAMSVLDHLSCGGAFVAVSTHFNRLKAYGVSNPKVVNASVEFDEKNQSPTFTLKYGSPGISHALETARDVGVPREVIDRARSYLDQDEVRLNRLIDKLSQLIADAAREKEKALKARKESEAASRKMGEALARLEEERKTLAEEQRAEVEQAIRQAREELRAAINTLKKEKRAAQARVNRKYDEVARNLRKHPVVEVERGSLPKAEGLKSGQFVYHKKLRQGGVVQSLDASEGRALIRFGNMNLSARIRDLEVMENQGANDPFEQAAGVSWRLKGSAVRELNLIGYRVVDALPLIDQTIDRALVEGGCSLRIVHGYGTGKLREAIREHLRHLSFVRRVSGEDPQSGGNAVTVVELN